VLDAQYCGLAQRRKRLFLIGHLGADWRPPAAVLFESHSLRRHPAPGREAGEEVAGAIAPTLTGNGAGGSYAGKSDGGDALVPFIAPTLTNGGKAAGSVSQQDAENGALVISRTLTGKSQPMDGSIETYVVHSCGVRHLTPVEYERLQGFPDDYTNIQFRNKPAADAPRYQAIGDSWAVPVARWVGERIQLVENIINPIP